MNKILVIEDEENIRSNIKDILELSKFTVHTTDNGDDGIKLAREKHPDLILCDIMLPGIDGYNVKYQLSKFKKTKTIPFIFLTAKSNIEDIRYGMDLGADDYITKPFKSESLIRAIQTRLIRFAELNYNNYKKERTRKASNAQLTLEDKILISNERHPLFLKIGEIKFITAEGDYSNIILKNGQKLKIRKLLSNWEKALPEKYFIRIHRSTIVNLEMAVRFEKWFKRSFIVYLKDEKEPFVVSQRFSTKLRSKLSL